MRGRGRAVWTYRGGSRSTIETGPGDCGESVARFYVIYSNEDGVVADPMAPAGQVYWSELVPIEGVTEYRGEIPPEATFLTLATGSESPFFCRPGEIEEGT